MDLPLPSLASSLSWSPPHAHRLCLRFPTLALPTTSFPTSPSFTLITTSSAGIIFFRNKITCLCPPRCFWGNYEYECAHRTRGPICHPCQPLMPLNPSYRRLPSSVPPISGVYPASSPNHPPPVESPALVPRFLRTWAYHKGKDQGGYTEFFSRVSTCHLTLHFVRLFV